MSNFSTPVVGDYIDVSNFDAALSAALRSSIAAATQPFASREAWRAATLASDVQIASWRGAEEQVFYVVRMANGPIQQANGDRWAPTGFPTPEHFGAVGDYFDDSRASTDDTAALQALFDWMGSHLCHAPAAMLAGRYRTTSTLVYNGRGKKLEFATSSQMKSRNVSVHQIGLICCDFTAGPGIWVYGDQPSTGGYTITASATRRAAPASANGAGTLNCGVLIEPPDVEDAEVQGVDLREGACVGHPGGGLVIEGAVVGITIVNCYEVDIPHGHGKSFTSGQLSGRTHIGRPGIITIIGGKCFDTGGHGLAIGHPQSGSWAPYRVDASNHEAYRGGLDENARYTAHGDYVVAEGAELHCCGHTGSDAANNPNIGALAIGGAGILHRSGRFIDCVGHYVSVVQTPGIATQGLEIVGSAGSTDGGNPPVFAMLAPGVTNVRIAPAKHDCTSPITDIAVNATNEAISLTDAAANKTVIHNTSIEHRGVAVKNQADNKHLHIVNDAITVDGPGVYRLRTEGLAATDVLATINGGAVGDTVLFMLGNSAQTVLIVENTGNIRHEGSTSHNLDTATSWARYQKIGANWLLIGSGAY